MQQRSILISVALLLILVLAACAPASPAQTEESSAAPAASEEQSAEEPAEEATEEPAEEAEATEEPAEEAEATEEPAEEAEATEEPAEESPAASEGESATYVVDTEASSVEWYGFRPAGGSESGTVQIQEGQLNFEGTTLIDGNFVIDMTTIETTSQSGGMADRLQGHLTSDDFFGVETYPTATLVLKSAEPTEVENQYLVTGDLTIKETTDEIEFLTDVNVGDGSLDATAEIIVDRATYDVRYGSGSFFDNLGDDLISDEMTLTVNLVATQ